MRLFGFLLASLALVSCAETKTLCREGNTTSGLCLFFDGDAYVSFDEVDELVSVVEDEAQVRYAGVSGLPGALWDAGVRATFVDGQLSIGCKRVDAGFNAYTCEPINGVFYTPEYEIFVEHRRCLANSALAHELLHFIEDWYMNIPSEQAEGHRTKWMFTRDDLGAKNIYTVEGRVEKRLLYSLDSCRALR